MKDTGQCQDWHPKEELKQLRNIFQERRIAQKAADASAAQAGNTEQKPKGGKGPKGRGKGKGGKKGEDPSTPANASQLKPPEGGATGGDGGQPPKAKPKPKPKGLTNGTSEHLYAIGESILNLTEKLDHCHSEATRVAETVEIRDYFRGAVSYTHLTLPTIYSV